ncbi:MAG: SpoIIIAH-like family protein [Oscillospiraceae bacterium]
MNMILGKKQIILASLVVGLGIAVYLNVAYTNQNDLLETTQKLDTSSKEYGDSQYVGNQNPENINTETYFAQAKITRSKSRDEAVETLKMMLSDADLDETNKTSLALKATEIAKSIETEGKIENLIKAKGFEQCMVYYNEDRVDIIVKTQGLLENEVVQMKDIILKEANIPVENISIVEIN